MDRKTTLTAAEQIPPLANARRARARVSDRSDEAGVLRVLASALDLEILLLV